MSKHNKEKDYSNLTTYNKSTLITGFVLGSGCILGGFLMLRYKTSKSNEWLVRTGLGISDIQIGKKFFKWPFQNIEIIDMSPKSYKFAVNAMSKEKMEFNFPAVFTIGTKNNNESLINFSRFLLNQNEDEINSLIRGIIEGETRSMSANLEIESIFTGRTDFKKDIVDNVQSQLNQYGLEIYNANIEELKDGLDSNYFKSLSRRIQAEASNRANIDVSEQNKMGDIGVKEREAETRKKLALIEADAALVENERSQVILKSKAELEKIRSEQDLIIIQAKIRSENEAQIIKMSMEKDVEIKRSLMEIEKQRANDLSSTQVQAEMLEKETIGNANSQKILADAKFYSLQKEAEGMIYYKLKESEGIKAIYEAQSEGLKKLVESFDGDKQALISYTMMDKGIFEKLAASNADAIKGLNPKITVWTNDASNSMDTIKNLGKSLIPMIDTIQDQTGYKLPDWMIEKTKTETEQNKN
uniref:Band 7 domain-containing protein n=1 Tax=viral metagenome TaxID=1070528 RepID=A0A6C0ADD4_9ZZZZ